MKESSIAILVSDLEGVWRIEHYQSCYGALHIAVYARTLTPLSTLLARSQGLLRNAVRSILCMGCCRIAIAVWTAVWTALMAPRHILTPSRRTASGCFNAGVIGGVVGLYRHSIRGTRYPGKRRIHARFHTEYIVGGRYVLPCFNKATLYGVCTHLTLLRSTRMSLDVGHW